jgi:hypothetical protein
MGKIWGKYGRCWDGLDMFIIFYTMFIVADGHGLSIIIDDSFGSEVMLSDDKTI